MDIHIIDAGPLLAEDVARAHVQDLKVEKRFGVKQLKYWVDTANKKVFCLMRGPNPAACHAVHVQSHGMTACNIVELTDNESSLLLLGSSINDLAYAASGEGLDNGFRTLLRLDSYGIPEPSLVQEVVARHNGHLLLHSDHHDLAFFHDCTDALRCAVELAQAIRSLRNVPEYQIGITTGQFLDRHSGHLFEAAQQVLQGLAYLGMSGYTIVDRATCAMLSRNNTVQIPADPAYIKLTDQHLIFLTKVLPVVEAEMTRPSFTVSRFNQLMGLSKASAYRAVKSLLDVSPSMLIQQIRLRRALDLLAAPRQTVAEVTYAVGFSSPSYFSRVFKNRYGYPPSDCLAVQ